MSLTDKIKGRIRRALAGTLQSRVYFLEPEGTRVPAKTRNIWGIYKLKHRITHLPFHVDSKGRITLYEG